VAGHGGLVPGLMSYAWFMEEREWVRGISLSQEISWISGKVWATKIMEIPGESSRDHLMTAGDVKEHPTSRTACCLFLASIPTCFLRMTQRLARRLYGQSEGRVAFQ